MLPVCCKPKQNSIPLVLYCMSPSTSIWLPDHRALALRQTPASSMLLAATRGQIHPEHVFAVTTLYSVTELSGNIGFWTNCGPRERSEEYHFWTYLNPARALLVASFKYQDQRVKVNVIARRSSCLSITINTSQLCTCVIINDTLWTFGAFLKFYKEKN